MIKENDNKLDPDDCHYILYDTISTGSIDPTHYCKSISAITDSLPDDIVVYNYENIIRSDLVWRFENYKSYLEKKYWSTRTDRIKNRFLLNDLVMFHGTNTKNIPGIIREGLLVPDRSKLRHTTGTRYGRGIYVTPNPKLSSCYSSDNYLFVCVVLPGKSYKVSCMEDDESKFWGSNLQRGHDSHISDDGSQIVLFHEGQVLPCYILHYRKKKKNEDVQKKYDNELKLLYNRRTCHISKEDDKFVRKTKIKWMTQEAKKYLPFGYGPGRFWVTEISEHNDDEDETGYQHRSYFNKFQKHRK